jgi:hypothetical protein
LPEDDWHDYATVAITAGVSLFELARFMGTSVDQMNDTRQALAPRFDRAGAHAA